MLVNIHDHNNTGKMDRNDAYKAPNGYYYSSEKAYKDTVEREAQRKKCIDYMHDILNYEGFMQIPTIFYKKLKEWEPYGFNVVYKAMMIADKHLHQALQTKNFDNEYNKVSYLSAIIANNLNDAFKIEALARQGNLSQPKIEADNIDNIGRKSVKTKSVADLLGGV